MFAVLSSYVLNTHTLPHSTIRRPVEGLASTLTQILHFLLSITFVPEPLQIIQRLIFAALLSS